jgi:hypothetical protein
MIKVASWSHTDHYPALMKLGRAGPAAQADTLATGQRPPP